MNHQVYVGVHVRDSPHDSPPAKWPLPIQNHSKWLAGTWERTTPARNDQINVQDRKNWKKWQNGMAKVEGSNFGRVSHRFIMFQHVTTSLSDTTWEPGKNGDELCPSPKSTSPCERASQSMPLQSPVMLGPKGSPYVGWNNTAKWCELNFVWMFLVDLSSSIYT